MDVWLDPDLREAWDKIPNIKLASLEDLAKIRQAGAPTFKQNLSEKQSASGGQPRFEPKGHDQVDARYIEHDDVIGWLFSPRVKLGNEGAGLMWLHGGIHLMGNPLIHEAMANQLVLRTGITVFIPQCLWAPENPFPKILEHAIRAFKWFSTRADATQTAIGGTTGGASVAISLALWARDNPNGIQPIAAVLADVPFFSADFGFSMSAEYQNPVAKIWSPQSAKFASDCYLPDSSLDPHNYAWPLKHPSYHDFPPCYFNIAHHDIARDAGAELALRILRESVEGCELHIRRGTLHGSASIAPNAAVTLEAHESASRFLLKLFNLPSPRQH